MSKIRIDKKTPGTDSVRVSVNGVPQTILINKGINFLEEKEAKAFSQHPLFNEICKAKKIAVYLKEERIEKIGIVVVKKNEVTPNSEGNSDAGSNDSNANGANDDDSANDDENNNKKPAKEPTEKEKLQARAKKLGISYPANATKAELNEMIEAVESAPDFVEPEADEEDEEGNE